MRSPLTPTASASASLSHPHPNQVRQIMKLINKREQGNELLWAVRDGRVHSVIDESSAKASAIAAPASL